MRSVIFSSFIISAAANQDFVVALLSALVGVFAVIVATLSIVLAKEYKATRKSLKDTFISAKSPINRRFVQIHPKTSMLIHRLKRKLVTAKRISKREDKEVK